MHNGRTIWTGQSEFYSRPTAEQLRAAIRSAAGERAVDVQRIGICVPGLLDTERKIITLAVNVPGIVGIPLERLTPEALGIEARGPTKILNDAWAAAVDIGQSRQLRGRLVLLTLGTGIGIAVADDGRPLHVEGESPGHFGQIDVSIAGHDVIGPDGGAGGLEGYLGAAALRQQYGPDLSATVAKFSGEEPAMLALGRAIRIAHAIYRPQHICLCGGIGIRLRHLLPPLRRKIETNLTSLARSGWTFTTGDDDFHAARGAATLAG
jgi:predicted NBD/HSP70 family sugar kinase